MEIEERIEEWDLPTNSRPRRTSGGNNKIDPDFVRERVHRLGSKRVRQAPPREAPPREAPPLHDEVRLVRESALMRGGNEARGGGAGGGRRWPPPPE